MVAGWLRLHELAEAARLPESTVRRYCRLFEPWLPSQGDGRARRWPPEAVAVLRRVADLYRDGYSTETVREHLAQEYPATMDTRAIPPEPAVTGLPAEVAQALMAALVRQAEELERLRNQVAETQAEVERARQEVIAAREELAAQRQEVAQARQEAAAAAKALRRLEAQEAEHQRREEEMARRLEEALAELRQAAETRRRPWWRRWLGR